MEEFMTPVTAEQIKKIDALKRALVIDEEFYKNLLLKSWGVDSSEKLTAIEAEIIIFEMEAKAIQFGVLTDPSLSKKHSEETSLTTVLAVLKRTKRQNLNRA